MRTITIPLSKYKFIDIINKPKKVKKPVPVEDITKSIRALFNRHNTPKIISYSCDGR